MLWLLQHHAVSALCGVVPSSATPSPSPSILDPVFWGSLTQELFQPLSSPLCSFNARLPESSLTVGTHQKATRNRIYGCAGSLFIVPIHRSLHSHSWQKDEEPRSAEVIIGGYGKIPIKVRVIFIVTLIYHSASVPYS